MKLLHYTYRKLSLFLFLLMALWGILFYYAIMDEVIDETDDTLQNYAHLLIKKTLREPSTLHTEGTIMSFYKFRPISEKKVIITVRNFMTLPYILKSKRIRTGSRHADFVPHVKRTILRTHFNDIHFGTR